MLQVSCERFRGVYMDVVKFFITLCIGFPRASTTKYHKLWLKRTEIYCLTFRKLKVQNQDAGCGPCSLTALGRIPSWLLWFLVFTDNPLHSLACRWITPFTCMSSPCGSSHCLPCMCSFLFLKFSSFIRTPVLRGDWLGAIRITAFLHDYVCKTPLCKVRFWGIEG